MSEMLSSGTLVEAACDTNSSIVNVKKLTAPNFSGEREKCGQPEHEAAAQTQPRRGRRKSHLQPRLIPVVQRSTEHLAELQR